MFLITARVLQDASRWGLLDASRRGLLDTVVLFRVFILWRLIHVCDSVTSVLRFDLVPLVRDF